MFWINKRTLVDSGQKTITEDVDAPEWNPATSQHNKSRKILVVRPEAIRNPGTHTGEPCKGHSAMEVKVCLSVFHEWRRHGADNGQFIRNASNMRKEGTDRNTALSVICKFPWTRQNIAVLIEHGSLSLKRHGLASLCCEPRFRIERVNVGEPSRHVAKNDVLNFRCKVRRLRCQWSFSKRLGYPRVRFVGHESG